MFSVRCVQKRCTISAGVRTRRENLAGTSFMRILHPLKFRLSAEDYAKYYFAGRPRARVNGESISDVYAKKGIAGSP